MDPDVWLCTHGEDHYEHIDVYVDDLLIASKEPKSETDVLTNKDYFKLKGTCPIFYHLSCAFGRDDDATLCFAPKKCACKVIDFYYSMLGTKPKLSFSFPLENGDHPELDASEHYF